MLSVRLLGQFSIQQDGHWVDLLGRPAQLLFAYLIIHAGVAQQREHLADLLWPESTVENARSNLRHTLWQLRKSLGTASCLIASDDFTLTFVPADECHIDVAELNRDPSTLHSDEQLMASVAVYDGDLLPGFYEPWVVLERERLQAVFEQKMELLLERLIVTQRWTAVVNWAERWIALGETPESAYRALMIAHARMGHMSQLEAAHQRCRDNLLSNLGLAPSVETENLYTQLIGCGFPESASEAAAPILPVAVANVGMPGEARLADLTMQLEATKRMLERERQIAAVHRRAATRSTRIMAGLALIVAALIGILTRDRTSR